MKELIGKSLGRYEILDLLGEGGMGAVFKARDATLQREVAIKVMHTRYAGQEDTRQRFMQEAQIAAKFNHPCIVPVYDFGRQEDLLYIVMKFVPGDNLHQMLQDMRTQKRWILLDEAIQVMIQVCQALDYAHRHGVLHRDIKPANIMLEPEPSGGLPYRPVLTDLGLAKLVEGGLETQVGLSMGTPAYMSPEQALGKDIDSRSDVYSLGILLYELAVGRLPFQIKTISEAVRCHAQEPPPPPRSVRPDLPESLEAIILKALEKDPANRYSDADSLATALKKVILDLTEVAEPTIAEGYSSLMTQYQQSLLSWRGASLIQEFPAASEEHGKNKINIQVVRRDKTSHLVPLKSSGMTIGRVADNDIVLEDPKVSRKHARIEFSKAKFWVTDLDSSNGTFLDKTRLLPGVPEEWLANVTLRVGDNYLRLIAGEELTVQPSSQDEAIPSPAVERIGLRLENAQLSVEPGSSSSTKLSLHNKGKLVDTFHVSVVGLPGEWFQKVEAVHLNSGEQEDVKLTLTVPRVPQSRAGRYPFTIRVASQDDPSQSKEINATLTVGAYSEYKSSLYPQMIKAGEDARVTVENLGNLQETYNLTWQDRGDELVFSPPSSQLRVAEGQSAAAEFNVEPRQRRMIGGEKSHNITAQVGTTAGVMQTLSGEVISKALIPTWAPPLMIILFLGLCAILYSFTARVPSIEFDYSPHNPLIGEDVKVFWKIKNAQRAELKGYGSVDPRQGEYTYDGGFSQTTTVYLVATNWLGMPTEAPLTIPIEVAAVPLIRVPKIVGLSEQEAKSVLTNYQLQIGEVKNQYSSNVVEGRVIESIPPEGTEVEIGTKVDLIVSLGLCVVPVPEVIGLDLEIAEQNLKNTCKQNLCLSAVSEETMHESVEAGVVIDSDPQPGVDVPCGSQVKLLISGGPCMVTIPNVIGQSEIEAKRTLETVCEPSPCLEVTSSEVYDGKIPEGNVVGTNPAPYHPVKCKAQVELLVSKGPCRVAVPQLSNKTEAEARNELANACESPNCLNVISIQEYDELIPEGIVIRSDPSGLEEVDCGTNLNLYISLGKKQPDTPPEVKAFDISPTMYVEGEEGKVTLSWNVVGADTVSIEPDLGLVNTVDIREIDAPKASTTYTLIAKNSRGETNLTRDFTIAPLFDIGSINFGSYPLNEGETNKDTGIRTDLWDCGIATFRAVGGDIQESGDDGDILKLYMERLGTTWWIRADIRTHQVDEAWSIGVMCFYKELARGYRLFQDEFTNLGDNVKYDTQIRISEYDICGIVGMAARGGDIQENDAGNIWLAYMQPQGGTWWITADFRSHNQKEDWDVNVLCVKNKYNHFYYLDEIDTDLGDNINYDTKIPINYACSIAGIAVKDGDIQENGHDGDIFSAYLTSHADTNTIWLVADFRTHNDNETWGVQLLCPRRDLLSWGFH